MFFPRADMKRFAKSRFQANRWPAIGVAAVAALLGAVGGEAGSIELPSFEFNMELGSAGETQVEDLSSLEGALEEFAASPWAVFALVMLGFFMLMAIAIALFLGNVVSVGTRGWFLRYQRGEMFPFGEMFAGFRFYGASLSMTLLRELYVFLWSLLFFIPGIVKRYAYSMAEYVLYENPHLSARQALKISKTLTDGYKGALFLLKLSWIGWSILNVFTLGLLGIFYINPYRLTTHAAAYEYLKEQALNSGRLSWQDFN